MPAVLECINELTCDHGLLFSRKRSLFSTATELTKSMQPCIRSVHISHNFLYSNFDSQTAVADLKQSPQSHLRSIERVLCPRTEVLQRHAVMERLSLLRETLDCATLLV